MRKHELNKEKNDYLCRKYKQIMNIKRIVLVAVLMIATMSATAQSFEVKDFEEYVWGTYARTHPVKDYQKGELCAVIRFSVPTRGFKFTGDGVMKQTNGAGEVCVYVPKGTEKITIRHPEYGMIRDYKLPVAISSGTEYRASIMMTRQLEKPHYVYVGAGYNVTTLAGPSLALGFDYNRHNVELGFIYGTQKTDDIYLYTSGSSVAAAYNYKAMRVSLRYGYDFHLTDFVLLTPQAGVAYNHMKGTEIENYASEDIMNKMNTMSGLLAVRLTTVLNNHFRIQITPEFDFGVYEDENFKSVKGIDNQLKSWTTGLNLNVGLQVFF
jgi:opacity protein-like surface antigen